MIDPIYCLSKNRADRDLAKTIVHFQNWLSNPPEFFLVVEPQDAEKYREVFPGVPQLLLPKNDGGLPFARQFVLEHAEKRGTAFWMLDDDISGFFLAKGGKTTRTNMHTAFEKAQKLLAMSQEALGPNRILGQAALEYQQFAWSAQKDVGWRGYCDVAVWINAPALHGACAYRAEMALKEDRDFTLQVLSAGCETARLRKIAFSAPKNGTNAGGLKELYARQGREEEAVDRMVKAWPRVVTKQLKPDGRIDCKIAWKEAFVPQ